MTGKSKKSAEKLLSDLLQKQLDERAKKNPQLAAKQWRLLQILTERANAEPEEEEEDGLPASFLNDNDPPGNDSMFEGGPEVQAEIKRAASRLFPPKKRRTPDQKLAENSSDESPDDSKKSD